MKRAHLEYEILADLAEGLLDDDSAASATEHLADCDECRERSAELSDVSRLLAEAPVPPMPAELAARIDAAVAAESVSTATVASLQARRGRRHLRMLSAAAAAVVVVGGGTVAVRSAMNSSVTREAPRAAVPGPKQEHSDPRSSGVVPNSAFSNAKYHVTESGTDYRDKTLGTQVTGLVRRLNLPAARPGAPDRPMPCVHQVARGRDPLLVDVARYDGSPATVIVARTAASGSAMDVWVVRDCSGASADVVKHTQTSP